MINSRLLLVSLLVMVLSFTVSGQEGYIVIDKDTVMLDIDTLQVIESTQSPYYFVDTTGKMDCFDTVKVSGIVENQSKSVGCGVFCSSGVIEVLDTLSGGYYYIIIPCLTTEYVGTIFDAKIVGFSYRKDCSYRYVLSTFNVKQYYMLVDE